MKLELLTAQEHILMPTVVNAVVISAIIPENFSFSETGLNYIYIYYHKQGIYRKRHNKTENQNVNLKSFNHANMVIL